MLEKKEKRQDNRTQNQQQNEAGISRTITTTITRRRNQAAATETDPREAFRSHSPPFCGKTNSNTVGEPIDRFDTPTTTAKPEKKRITADLCNKTQ
ncbi:hypothetical protein QL285_075288 [Trifolium repens]|jgi:hypothetical protein|nr:hypothetical protein QL285_075288 [Trifolium repens]